jgi:outer membrane protein
MSRTLTLLALGLGLVVAGIVRVQASDPDSDGVKIGYVDLQRTLNETRAGKKAKKRLEGEKVKKQKELDEKQKALQQFAEELDKQRALLKPDVVRERERDLQQKYIELQEHYMKLQQDLARQEADLVREIFTKAAPVIEEIAKRDGFTMLFEKSESAVLWAHPSTDLTNEVNRRLDAKK